MSTGDLKDEGRIDDTFSRTVGLVLDLADILAPTARAMASWVKIVNR
jgi:hypothetical protein